MISASHNPALINESSSLAVMALNYIDDEKAKKSALLDAEEDTLPSSKSEGLGILCVIRRLA